MVIKKKITLKIITRYLEQYQKSRWGLIMKEKTLQFHSLWHGSKANFKYGVNYTQQPIMVVILTPNTSKKEKNKVYTIVFSTIWEIIAWQNKLFEWMEWMCNGSKVGKTQKWSFAISEKTRRETTDKLFKSHLERKKECVCKKWERTISVQLHVKEALVVFIFKIRVGDKAKNA